MTSQGPRYPKTAITAKRGVNHVRTTVEDAGSLFIKIDQENDLGIDALIELIQDNKPLNLHIAIQIKSGQSYYNSETEECLFPIGHHRDYWSKHSLPVYGIVYIPTLRTAHWINLKRFLKENPQASTVKFRVSKANQFAEDSFSQIFIPGISQKIPTLSAEEAVRLVHSSKMDEAYLGIVVLFRRFPNMLRTWDEFLQCLRERPAEQIPGHLVYFLAHVPGHGDIFYFGEQLTPATRAYARARIAELEYADIVKLLSLIDPETSISRGSLGQSIEALVASLPDFESILQRVIATSTVEMFTRECAAIILAMHRGMRAAPALEALKAAGSWQAGELLVHLREWGHINPYM